MFPPENTVTVTEYVNGRAVVVEAGGSVDGWLDYYTGQGWEDRRGGLLCKGGRRLWVSDSYTPPPPAPDPEPPAVPSPVGDQFILPLGEG